MCSRVPETESSESDASNEPGQKEDPPHRGARLAGEMEEDPEAAGTDQEEAGGVEPPSAQLELAILNENPRTRGHERDPAEHPSETGSAAGPGAHQGKPPG